MLGLAAGFLEHILKLLDSVFSAVGAAVPSAAVPGTPLPDKSFSQGGIVQFEGYRSHRGVLFNLRGIVLTVGNRSNRAS